MASDSTRSGRHLRVAALQLNSQSDVAANLAQCERLLEEAAEERVKLAVLPENFAFVGGEGESAAHAESLEDPPGPIQSALRRWARQFDMTIVAGGLPERSGDPARPYNSSVVYAPTGEVVARYRKVHLFDVDLPDGTSHRESAGNTPGEAPEVVRVGPFQVGLAICYDLRFPELFRAEVAAGAEVLTVPAAFTLHTGRDHWHVLLRARAIENQCWVIAAAQWGQHRIGTSGATRVTYGHSLIVDPWGTVVADCSDGVGMACATIRSEPLERTRQSVPCLKHRRL